VNLDLQLALQMADAADAISKLHFRAIDLVVETKPDLTPVTIADRAVEDELRKMVPETDAVVGEESGVSGPSGSRRRWIIDPIDGTKNFVRQIPVWATLIGLEEDGEITVGVASAPALGRRWWAARGEGAFANAEPIHVSAVSTLDDAQVSYSSLSGWAGIGSRDRFLDLAERCWRTRAFGDFWSHVLVAEGSCEIGLDPEVSLWDLAALQVIVEEAGGRFTDLSGKATPAGGSAVSTNGNVHDEVLKILNG